jgi:putative photosynthetic complex assembly protein
MSHDHASMMPRGSVPLCLAMVGLTLVAATVVRVGGIAPSASPVLMRAADHVAPVASRDLRFRDRADGAVTIEDVSNGRPAGLVGPGTKSGFIRGVMRGLARDRYKRGIGDGPPFRLTAWRDGELSLTDLATGRTLELTAFGSTNRAAFAALLTGAEQ